jgi:hypothetical protein
MYTDCQHKNSGYFAGIFEIGYYRWAKKIRLVAGLGGRNI